MVKWKARKWLENGRLVPFSSCFTFDCSNETWPMPHLAHGRSGGNSCAFFFWVVSLSVPCALVRCRPWKAFPLATTSPLATYMTPPNSVLYAPSIPPRYWYRMASEIELIELCVENPLNANLMICLNQKSQNWNIVIDIFSRSNIICWDLFGFVWKYPPKSHGLSSLFPILVTTWAKSSPISGRELRQWMATGYIPRYHAISTCQWIKLPCTPSVHMKIARICGCSSPWKGFVHRGWSIATISQ